MSISENIIRVGRFTSSDMHKLMTRNKSGNGFGAPGLTYIKEKNWERKMGRSLSVQKHSNATKWGHFLERRVHNLLGLSYESVGDISIKHPTIEYWAGSPDNKNMTESVVGDTKCYEPKAFAEYVDNLTLAYSLGSVDLIRNEHPKEYWQLISNAIILGVENIEAIVYMPYESELEEIREMVLNYDGADQYKYRFIAEAPKSELAYLPDGGQYKNLNVFRFKAPIEDMNSLTESVNMAIEMLDMKSGI